MSASMMDPKRRFESAAELFAGGRLSPARGLADALWLEGDRSPGLAALRGELALLSGRLHEAEEALGLALGPAPEDARLRGLLAETLLRADRLAAAAGLFHGLGRRAFATKLAHCARLAGWYRLAADTRGAVRVPWMLETRAPMVEARVDGRPVNLLIDIGVGETLLDARLAREIGVRTFGSEQIQFSAGAAGVIEHGVLERLSLPGSASAGGATSLELGTVPVALHETRAAFGESLPVPVDGILGVGVLARFLTTLDYRERVLILDPEGRLAGGVPLYLGGEHHALVESRLNDRTDCLLLLEPGMSGHAVTLPLATARLTDLDLSLSTGSGAYGVAANRQAHPITLREVSALGVTRRNMPGILTRTFEPERRLGLRVGGLLGQGFVDRAALLLDFRNGRTRLAGL